MMITQTFALAFLAATAYAFAPHPQVAGSLSAARFMSGAPGAARRPIATRLFDMPTLERTSVKLEKDKQQQQQVQEVKQTDNSNEPVKDLMNGATTMMVQQQKDKKDENIMQKIKDAGVAGAVSYAVWELLFWAVSVPVVLVGYQKVMGHWPDLSDKEDLAKLGAEAFAFVNFARLAVPLRVGLALSTTPWVKDNIVDRFLRNEDEENNRP